MTFDYHRDTRDRYKSDDVAQSYHDAFTSTPRHARDLLVRLIASRERNLVRHFLHAIPRASTVLDVPAGTGKMAHTLVDLADSVVACDVSMSMLQLARAEYLRVNPRTSSSFVICDAEHLDATFPAATFDVALCIRLLHRVPSSVKRRIVSCLSHKAQYTILSLGLSSTYHTRRSQLRRFLVGGEPLPESTLLSHPQVNDLVRPHFELADSRWVLPALSREKIYLLRSRHLQRS